MKNPAAIDTVFVAGESTGQADMVCFRREIEKLAHDGLIKVDYSDDPHDSWVVAKVTVSLDVPRTIRSIPNTTTAGHVEHLSAGLRDTDNRSAAVQKTPWRVSLDSMQRRIKSIEYIYPPNIPHMTIAVIILDNGYALIGESAPADAANFNVALGKEYAYENAMKKMWPLEAYVMRDLLSGHIEMHDPNERWGV